MNRNCLHELARPLLVYDETPRIGVDSERYGADVHDWCPDCGSIRVFTKVKRFFWVQPRFSDVEPTDDT